MKRGFALVEVSVTIGFLAVAILITILSLLNMTGLSELSKEKVVALADAHRVLEAMHTALRQPGLLGHAAYALPTMIIKALENPQTFRPKSHVGLCSERLLNSWPNSVLQRT